MTIRIEAQADCVPFPCHSSQIKHRKSTGRGQLGGSFSGLELPDTAN